MSYVLTLNLLNWLSYIKITFMLINFKLDTGKESNKKDLRLIYEIKFKMPNNYLSIYDFFMLCLSKYLQVNNKNWSKTNKLIPQVF
jgi:hypothetical protein